MTDSRSCTPILNRFGLLILFTLLTAALPFSALAQSDSFSVQRRAQFYLKMMPQQLQTESTIELADYGTFQQACFQTSYGSWARPMKSPAELSQRYSFLISKLNRPFYFQYVPRNDSKLHIIGSLDDFREMICVGLVLNDGKTGDEATSEVPSDFIKTVLRLPNINSQVLDLMLQLWDKSDRDAETGLNIVTHPLFNEFNLRYLVGSLFKKTMPVAARMSLLQTILKSDSYSRYSSEIFSLLLSESSNFISTEERFLMTRILAKEKNFDHTALLNFATFAVDTSKDYADLYLQLSKGQPLNGQFQILSTMLNAGANASNTEGIFLEIWKQSSDRDLRDSMTAFAQNDLSKSRWLSRDTIHRVTLERLSEESVSAKTVKMTLSFYLRSEESSPETKLSVMRRLGQQQASFDVSTAENFIDMATELSAANPSVESEISSTVSDLGMRLRQSDSVLTAYVRYLKNMNSKKAKMLLVQKLLPEPRVEERDLLLIAESTYDASSASYPFLELMLTQPQITARGLSELIGIVRPTRFVNLKPDLSDGARKILTLILGHVKATDQVREDANRYLNPTIQFIEDPGSNRH